MEARKQILSQIKAKGLNQRKMAKKLGMSESQFSQSLKILSEGFIDKLAENGINIDSSTNISGDINGSMNKGHIAHSTVNETNHHHGSNDLAMRLVESLETTVSFLRNAIQEKDKLINVMTQALQEKDILIKEMETNIVNGLDVIYNYIVEHDKKCKERHDCPRKRGKVEINR